MILKRSYLNYIKQHYGFYIDEPLTKYLLARYEEEHFPYEYSEQDLDEQIRKLIYQYEQGTLDISVKSPKQRLKDNYEALKDFCLDILKENEYLKDENLNLKKVLTENGLMDKEEVF